MTIKTTPTLSPPTMNSQRIVGRQFRMWMPTMPLQLVSIKESTATHPLRAVFRTLPRMTKHEIKEYLTQIYDLPVRQVNTMNYLGKRKKVLGKYGAAYYKYKDFKKAVVTFDKDVEIGLGMRIPELEETENNMQT